MTKIMANEIDELKDAIRYLEFQLVEKKRDLENTMRELELANTNTVEQKNHFAREVAVNRMQAEKLNDLEFKLKEQRDGKEELAQRMRLKVADFQNEINTREEELARVRARLHQKAEELKVAEIGMMAHKTKASLALDDYNVKSSQVERLAEELRGTKQDLIESKATRKSEGTALLEIEHLKADNDRLIKLLQATKEYKNFSKFALDNLGSVRFMPATKKNRCPVRNCGANTITENVNPNLEEENWVPQEAFDIAYKYKQQYGNELTDTLINKLLKTLNVVWRDRERRQIARVKNN